MGLEVGGMVSWPLRATKDGSDWHGVVWQRFCLRFIGKSKLDCLAQLAGGEEKEKEYWYRGGCY